MDDLEVAIVDECLQDVAEADPVPVLELKPKGGDARVMLAEDALAQEADTV